MEMPAASAGRALRVPTWWPLVGTWASFATETWAQALRPPDDTDATVEFATQPLFREAAVGERLAVDDDPWGKHHACPLRDGLAVGAVEWDGPDREAVVRRQPIEDGPRVLAEGAVVLGQQFDFHLLRRLFVEAGPDVGDQIGHRYIHRVVRSTSVVGSPRNLSVRSHHDERMAVPACPHHPVLVG